MCVNVCVRGWVFLSRCTEMDSELLWESQVGFWDLLCSLLKSGGSRGLLVVPGKFWYPVVRLLCETLFDICSYRVGGKGKQQTKVEIQGSSSHLVSHHLAQEHPSAPDSVGFGGEEGAELLQWPHLCVEELMLVQSPRVEAHPETH